MENLDKAIVTYSCRRMTARWPLAVFHNILDVSSYNAFVRWRELTPNWMPGKLNKRRVFLEKLGRALVIPSCLEQLGSKRLPRTEASAALVKAVQRATSRNRPEEEEDKDEKKKNKKEPAAPDVAPSGPSKRKRCQICPPKNDCKNTHCVLRLQKIYLQGLYTGLLP